MANFIDANVIVYAFLPSSYHENCKKLLREIEEGKEDVVLNYLTIEEAYIQLEKNLGVEFAIDYFKKFIALHSVLVIDFNNMLFFEFLKKRERYKNLSFNDCIHYITAKMMNCDSIISYDKDFDTLDIKRVEP